MTAHQSALIASDIEAYLAEHERKDLLRLLTCGSVDDGKSTLIGRLLHDANLIYADHLAALESDSATSGTTGEAIDLALLMDGLKAEREQGITIDVAYRYFSTSRRKFIVADTPGHVQYTRNMVTGASTADLAVILLDARKGVLEQTRRHSFVTSLLGIRHVVVAVNKMDLVGHAQARFEAIRDDYLDLASQLSLPTPWFVPISALTGDNVVTRSAAMPWFDGPALLEHLETVEVADHDDPSGLRFPVQLVQRPDADFRGFAGTVASGRLQRGQAVVALPSGLRSRIDRLVTFDGDLEAAGPGQAVTVTLTDEIDLSRGDLLVNEAGLPERAHELDVDLVWLGEQPATVGRDYVLLSANGVSNATLADVHHRVDVSTLERSPADRLELNDVARCVVSSDRELVFDPYRRNRTTGSFILVDRLTNATVGAGMIVGATSGWDQPPPPGMAEQGSTIAPAERRARLGQRPATVLITGLDGSGKSTIAAALERRLFDLGRTVLRLDGENLRRGISRDLGFGDDDRSENLRRAAEIAALAAEHGLITLVAVQAPHAAPRARVRDLLGADATVEVHLDAPEAVRRERVPRAAEASGHREGAGAAPTAATFEPPTAPDLRLDTARLTVDACVDAVIEVLTARGFLVGR